jgi:uncharacterized protein
MIARLLDLLLALYQRTLSPDHGPLAVFFPFGVCRYQPTCSQYARTVIKERGMLRGMVRTAWRILRCNPWSAGGNSDNIESIS